MLIINPTHHSIKRCAKCGAATGRIIRHHKGNDLFFGRHHKGIKDNYHKFFFVVQICENPCHAIIHVIYRELVDCSKLRRTRGKKKRALVEKLRKQCIQICNQWLKGKDFGVTEHDYRVLDLLKKWGQ